MKKESYKALLAALMASAMVFGVTGCGSNKDTAPEQETQESEAAQETEVKEESEVLPEQEETEAAAETEASGQETESASAGTEERADRLLVKYYETVLLPKEGLVKLPSGEEVPLKEHHYENYSIGEAFLQNEGICYHAVWDYDKDEQDELMVLSLDKDKDYDRSKIYARMYEVVNGEVVETAELESFFGWMEFDLSQSTEIFLRETKDWFYLAEEASGSSGIYADGVSYAIRVAHYDGKDFVVDVAKQISGSDFSDTDKEVADTARLLTYVGFDNTAKNLTYQYHFDKNEPLLSIFYMTAEHDGDMNKYYQSGNITDVPPFLVRMFESGNDKSVG